jgi:hypothetical protein
VLAESEPSFTAPSGTGRLLTRLRDRAESARSRRTLKHIEWLKSASSPHVCSAVVHRTGSRPMTVIAQFDDRNGLDADAPTGRLTTVHRLPVGEPVQLHLDSGPRGIVVIVADNGRFFASGPLS